MPIGIAGAILGAGVLSAGAGLIASSNASNAASNAASQNNALESQIYNTNKGLEQPYITSGDNAETALNGFLGLGGDPAATQAAFNNYLSSTGYQFDLDQGEQAAEQSKASQGMLNSGATLKALDTYGAGLAQQFGQAYVGNLQNETVTGAGSANALAGQGQTYAGQVSANNNSAASASGAAGVSAANALSGIAGTGLSAYALGQGASSYGGGGAYNAFAPPIGG